MIERMLPPALRENWTLPLPHSTRQVPPHSIMLAVRTGRGTLISVTGRIDGVAQ